MMTKDQIILAIIKGVPYSQHIAEIDLSTENDGIRFTWRGDKFRVSVNSLMVETIEGNTLAGSNLAILMERIIKQAAIGNIQ